MLPKKQSVIMFSIVFIIGITSMASQQQQQQYCANGSGSISLS